MDSKIARGCCSDKQLEISNDNKDRLVNYFDQCAKLDSFNWLRELSENNDIPDIVEVRFKNTRKEYYNNVNDLRLKRGDFIAVEASPGHDIGIITLAGEIVEKQLVKTKFDPRIDELKKVYRKAKTADIEKWEEAIQLENETMLKARSIADQLKLNMKIGDVEYQGDRTKAIFYYIADERVDFRELIKVLAETFRIRIEMRQIGARQEAGRIGGIGTCGRELCCSTFITSFVSVSTQAARIQEVALNPTKLAGQCGKLKCCLNYEADCYSDARKSFPDRNIALKTAGGKAIHQKTDVHRGVMWYSLLSDSGGATLIPVPVERVKAIIALNKKDEVPDTLIDSYAMTEKKSPEQYADVVGQESITRFETKKNNRTKNRNKGRNKPRPQQRKR
ncbi:MAG: regulatory iron-sulfur-containing complex subunit RicT [Bacteroidales bacterium]|jgi:cell fate regulator YaaT (PSP1 superfamily)|nr:regulatory iron-sulfur-containing complex subunit RicT [Bacteroidales bacterium]